MNSKLLLFVITSLIASSYFVNDIFAAEENSMGEIRWIDTSYLATGTGVVRIIDSDMNIDPKAVDNFDVDVWSDSDAAGTDPTMTETGPDTGVFESTVFFTTADESSGHKLKVSVGDTITAEYQDNTLPEPYVSGDELYLTATSQIHATSLKVQLTNNVSQEKIVCSSSFHVLTERPSGDLACVYPTTAIKLGWEMLNAYTNAEIIPQES